MANNDFDPMFDAAGRYYNVDPALLKTIFHVESGGNANVGRGTSGEIGPMQLMPATAQQYHVQDAQDMTQAIPAAAQIMRKNLDATKGNVAQALQMYNGGPGGPMNPRTVPYVSKAANLYPQMGVKASPGSDNAASLGDQIISGGGPPAQKGGQLSDPAMNVGDQLISESIQGVKETPPPAAPPSPEQQQQQITNPQTGAADTMAPGLRSFITENPNYTYGTVLPLARNKLTGTLSPAVPGALHEMAGGLLDLAEGPATGTVTPQGTMALTNMLMTNPRLFGSPASPTANAARAADAGGAMQNQLNKENYLSPDFKAAPFSPDYAGLKAGVEKPPTADPADEATSKMANLLHSMVARQMGRATGAFLGHTIGDVPGAVVGYIIEPYLQRMAADYGPKVTGAVLQSLKNQFKGFVPENYMWRPAPTLQQPQNPLTDNRPLA